MSRRLLVVGAMIAGLGTAPNGAAGQENVRRLPVPEYVSRMKAGWVGQMAGVGWGGPTEFKVRGEIMGEDRLPKWRPAMINQFHQDDIYVEMTFLQTLDTYGLDVSIRQAGIDFANSGYPLWHANRAGRDNLRKGIAPPDSGHPKFNKHADDIDYQIEADYSGLIAPGMPNVAVRLGETFGRLMNYGDGLFAGQFVGAMYAEAFFESDPVQIARAALKAVPARSQYAEMVRDVLQWYAEEPDDWQKAWQRIEAKYHQDPKYTHGLCSKPGGKGAFSIDAKLNGAYILVGLLYGKGDPDRTIILSTRCGQDSDCNPSNAGGILFTTIGFEKLPKKFTSAIDPKGKFSHTPYTFPKLIEVSVKLVRQAVLAEGGKVEKSADGEEVFVIPVKAPKPSELEHVARPRPPADSKFTEQERAKIKPPAPRPRTRSGVSKGKADIAKAVEEFAPGWKAADCGSEMDPGLRPEWGGRKNVLVTHPMSTSKPCVLRRTVDIPAGKKTTLVLDVAPDGRGDWTLAVQADGKQLLKKKIDKAATQNGWATVEVDLSELAGRAVPLELHNVADGWSWEAAYWSRIEVRAEE